MPTTVLTYEDLLSFKKELFEELKSVLANSTSTKPNKWLRSKQVREMLQISNSTLMTLRINGTIPYIRMGGAYLYDYDEIMKVLAKNTIDHKLS